MKDVLPIPEGPQTKMLSYLSGFIILHCFNKLSPISSMQQVPVKLLSSLELSFFSSSCLESLTSSFFVWEVFCSFAPNWVKFYETIVSAYLSKDSYEVPLEFYYYSKMLCTSQIGEFCLDSSPASLLQSSSILDQLYSLDRRASLKACTFGKR